MGTADDRTSWKVTVVKYDDSPMVFRVDTAFRRHRPAYPIRIGVALPARTAANNGMPATSESASLQDAEDRLSELAGDRAVLVAVISGKAMREFVFYASGSDWIAEFHAEAQKVIQTHEVQMIANVDAGWGVYQDLLSAVASTP